MDVKFTENGVRYQIVLAGSPLRQPEPEIKPDPNLWTGSSTRRCGIQLDDDLKESQFRRSHKAKGRAHHQFRVPPASHFKDSKEFR